MDERLGLRRDHFGSAGAANDIQYVRRQLAHRPLDTVQGALTRKFMLKVAIEDFHIHRHVPLQDRFRQYQ